VAISPVTAPDEAALLRGAPMLSATPDLAPALGWWDMLWLKVLTFFSQHLGQGRLPS
jgi:hypothetical protein